ncbi:MAG: porin [Proteobacteria bacterium]|nr:porin [Pseudomonadota bacterium]
MNKLLLGTTALVGASLLMVGGAYAAKPKMKLGGGTKVEIGGASQDFEAFSDAAGRATAGPNRGYFMSTDAELHFNFSGKTDAGMKWKAQIQFETDANVAQADPTKESAIDETWIRFSGSWGQVNLGTEDGAEDLMHVSGEGAAKKAGTGGVDGHWDEHLDTKSVNSRFALEPTLKKDSSDHVKATYFTPRIGGLQVGVSFTPDTGAVGGAPSNDNQTGNFENTWGFGVQYKKKFGGVKVAAAGVLHIGDEESETKEDLTAWMVGAEVGYGGWKLGGAYQDNGDGGETKGVADDDMTGWDVGLGYSSGPVHLAVSYVHSEVEVSASDEDTLDAVVVGGTYVLGGGAKVYAEVFWMDTEAGGGGTTNNEGYGFILGTAVKF